MEVTNNRKCKNCGADMVFEPQTGKIICRSCGNKQWIYNDFKKDLKPVGERDIDELKGRTVKHHWMLESDMAICENCGGEVAFSITDKTVVCPYCDSNLVVKDLEKKVPSPDGVVLFRLSEKDARSSFIKWVDSQFMCPKEVKRIAKKERYVGVYLPCWTFDVETHITCTGTYVDEKREVSFNDSGDKFVNDRLVVATDKYEVEHIRKTYPYKTERNRPYKDEYVAGFQAEKYTIPIESAWKNEKPLLDEDLKKQVAKEIKLKYAKYKKVNIENITISYEEPRYKYLLVPAWLSQFDYKGHTYEFIVNGENGKTAGELPISNRNRNIAILLCVLAALFVIKYAKYIFAVIFAIVLVVGISVAAIVWYIKKEVAKRID